MTELSRRRRPDFVLSIPAHGMEPTVLAIGKVIQHGVSLQPLLAAAVEISTGTAAVRKVIQAIRSGGSPCSLHGL